MVDHYSSAPCSFLLRLRIMDTAAADAILHPTAGTTTDVETIPLAADADAMRVGNDGGLFVYISVCRLYLCAG